MNVNGDILSAYSNYVTDSVSAFIPLVATVIGIFLAFAIANMLRHLILKMK